MASVNRIMLLGNLTRDPELRYTTKGKAVVSANLAVNHYYKNAQDEKKEEVCYIDLEAWANTALLFERTQKGSQIFIEGRLKLKQWESQEGVTRRKHVVVVERLQYLSKKKEAQPAGAPAGPPDDDVPF